jgi:NAD(P)-dependent dehydrogenase (short-subunit alcohol dehydrogenase family)
MSYFVTGATGFIGRHLVKRLLDEREGDVHVLVRSGSRAKLDAMAERWGHPGRVKPVTGDLGRNRLGVSAAKRRALAGEIEHFFHLAAVYDMTAEVERNRAANVEGTRHAVALANELEVGCFEHTSSVAVAGMYRGHFTEDMFEVGQPLEHPYHATKLAAERIARTATEVPWRVYRPAVVIGNSQTGEMDKIDGPYYFFALLQAAATLPEALPILVPALGHTNVVPVDYVAAAMDHIAHADGLDGQAFHLVNPEPQGSAEIVNELARAAGAPHVVEALPHATLRLLDVPDPTGLRARLLDALGIPEEVLAYLGFTATFDHARAAAALRDSDIAVPALHDYAGRLWEYWRRHLADGRLVNPARLTTPAARPQAGSGLAMAAAITARHAAGLPLRLAREAGRAVFSDRSLPGAVRDRVVLITGASSGIGRACALEVAAAGGVVLLVARGRDKLDETRAQIERAGGVAHTHPADLADLSSIDGLCAQVLSEHGRVDILVNNAGRSIRRSIELSYDRFHDFERTIQLNYLGAIRLIMGLLPSMRARGSGHVINISSIGVQTSPPRFAAYVASKAALDAFTRVVASESIGDGVAFTTIHMPLVRTPMIAPTKLYDAFPTISAQEAAELICDAMRTKPKHVSTRLGTVGEVAYALAPKAVDQVLHLAYDVFPDSAAAKGQRDPAEHASTEQRALAKLLPGVHW